MGTVTYFVKATGHFFLAWEEAGSHLELGIIPRLFKTPGPAARRYQAFVTTSSGMG
jgi:hypothetical protein